MTAKRASIMFSDNEHIKQTCYRTVRYDYDDNDEKCFIRFVSQWLVFDMMSKSKRDHHFTKKKIEILNFR